ncbi:uncharacterized protein BDR25DRAFT_319768 [Lindgomyces ingoldianus]|uniref:Uncharacterized protein n=1 Tax=Lindgomyces ingoldianus TaxID=673940 RepID=A0ACB6QC70_9PLEO|nr:uncharacterized protein BDR25DRAFT_319768 [Lindgomyces ingoldianus]KAF2463746.1 hypothetical protein BDR25DRAFT_319768 [Lindgomyces ingoldianus]
MVRLLEWLTCSLAKNRSLSQTPLIGEEPDAQQSEAKEHTAASKSERTSVGTHNSIASPSPSIKFLRRNQSFYVQRTNVLRSPPPQKLRLSCSLPAMITDEDYARLSSHSSSLRSRPASFEPSFPFLRLSKSLRRKIYEYLEVKTKYVVAMREHFGPRASHPNAIVMLRYISRTILLTCRTINREAEPILQIETMKLGPPRIIAHLNALNEANFLLGLIKENVNKYVWQPLRLRAADREGEYLTPESFNRLIFTRLACLYQQSRREVWIGLWVGPLSDWKQFLTDLPFVVPPLVRHWPPNDGSRVVVSVFFEGNREVEGSGDEKMRISEYPQINVFVDAGLRLESDLQPEDQEELFGVTGFGGLFLEGRGMDV